MAFTSNRAIAGSQDQRGITVTIEALDIQSAQLPTADEYYVIDIQAQSGTDSFTQTNGFTDYTYSGDLQIKAADEWGGADVSQYITQDYTEAAGFLESFKIDITEDQKYFGFWWSAGDPYNEITFKNDGETVASFRTENLVDFINNSGTVNTSDYQGNPNPIYDTLNNAHKTQPFSFVNVFFNDESAFDEIVITSDKNDSAFESDNHTFSEIKQTIRGEVIPNTAPVANDDTATVSIYNSVTIDVLANDTDPEGDATTITSVDSISGGDAVIEDNKIIYTAGSMPDEFFLTYTVQDAYGKTDSGTVTITVTAFSD
ncbi:MAG: Ig-like domain-containing protein [Cyanobacteria bacterium J06631_2]